MLQRVYIEITNRCNLACAFCPGTARAPASLAPEDFAVILEKLRGRVGTLYFHVMGEPLLHPQLGELLRLSEEFRVCLTTNGTLLRAQTQTLLAAKNLHKVSVSLHSFEGNDGGDMAQYLEEIWAFCTRATEKGILCVLRLWNEGGAEERNREILNFLEGKLGICVENLPLTRQNSRLLRERLYLEGAAKFDWPDRAAPLSGTVFCHGLREQLAVLADGTAVPCCLDHEGELALGNLLEQDLDEILQSPRAQAIYRGFTERDPPEELCRRCGYSARFGRGK